MVGLGQVAGQTLDLGLKLGLLGLDGLGSFDKKRKGLFELLLVGAAGYWGGGWVGWISQAAFP